MRLLRMAWPCTQERRYGPLVSTSSFIMAPASTSTDPDPTRRASSGTATRAIPATIDEPRLQSDRLTQPLERYSPGLFFMDSGEPTTYNEAIKATDVADWQRAMESKMNSIHENRT